MKPCRVKIPYIFLFSIIFFVSTNITLHARTSSENNLKEIDYIDYIERNLKETTFAQAPVVNKEAAVNDSKDNPEDVSAEKSGKESKGGLKPLIIKGTREKKKKEIQSVSRQTMTVDDMKEVPGSFGDSIGALTSLPGIIHAYGGFFGPLVIRGADPSSNNYFVDDIPMDNPMHFGGLHSVINTNLMKDIDVYSSAFPAEFGSATAAVINITTIDEVNEFGGYTDLSLLSAAALIKIPILTDKFGRLIIDTPSHPEKEDEIENKGYFIASGRYGYITLAIKAAELITGKKIPISPEYWDYQVKSKYKIDNKHSLSLFLFGHKDFIRVLIKSGMLEEGSDPLLADAKFQMDTLSHSQGLYLDSKFTNNFSNRLLYYSSLPETHMYINFSAPGVADWAKDINSHYRPWVFGLKDKVKLKWMDGHSELTGGPEYTFYYFTAKGKTLLPSGVTDNGSGPPDFGNPESFRTYQLDETVKNHKFGGYLENKFTYSGLTVLPGFRSEYFARTEQTTFDPRMMTSYKFPSDTKLSAAGGHYSYFLQTNPNYFNQNPDLSAISNRKIKPEKAWHSAIGAEQELGLYTIKVEWYSNYFYDMPEPYPHIEPDGSELQGFSSGQLKAHGFEIMIRKDSRENEDGLFGWLSYTYTNSRVKTGLPTQEGLYGVLDKNGKPNPVGDIYGDKWTKSGFEQRHSVKLVSGYKFYVHTFSTKFQYYSGFPYTPIDGLDTNFSQPDTYGRYTPHYGGRNSKNFPSYWQLDLRYTHKTSHLWGYISWYVEVINVFMKSDMEYKWYWDRTYSEGSNPKIKKQNGFNFLPNFGVEVKF
jgi:hypothetical protein